MTRRVETGLPGFDRLLNGGLPEGRTTILSGSPGSGKTVTALQFLWISARDYDQNGVLVTFGETPNDLIENVRSFGWNLAVLVEQKRLAVVDATPTPDEETTHTGAYDLSALVARVEHAVMSVGATRVVLDALDALFVQVSDVELAGREFFRLAIRLRRLGVTTLATKRRKNLGSLSEFASDSVVVLRYRLDGGERRRTVEVLRVRGATHRGGEHPFIIDPEHGFVVTRSD